MENINPTTFLNNNFSIYYGDIAVLKNLKTIEVGMAHNFPPYRDITYSFKAICDMNNYNIFDNFVQSGVIDSSQKCMIGSEGRKCPAYISTYERSFPSIIYQSMSGSDISIPVDSGIIISGYIDRRDIENHSKNIINKKIEQVITSRFEILDL